jgi:ABC-type arginine transport system permease subunit
MKKQFCVFSFFEVFTIIIAAIVIILIISMISLCLTRWIERKDSQKSRMKDVSI